MNVNRKNFGKAVLAGRALLGFNRVDLSSRARLGHETVARVERGEDEVSVNALAAIQRALEEAGVEFPKGTLQACVCLRVEKGLAGCAVIPDPSLPSGTRFRSSEDM